MNETKKPGRRDTLKCEPGKKEVRTPNVVLVSELRVTYGSEDCGDLSQRRVPRETDKHKQKISFIPSNVDSRCKGDNGKGMTGGHEEGTQKTKGKESPLFCIDGHPPHPKVRVHPGECSKKQSQVWKLSSPDEGAVHELPEKIDEAGTRAEHSNWDKSLTKRLTVVTNEKLRE